VAGVAQTKTNSGDRRGPVGLAILIGCLSVMLIPANAAATGRIYRFAGIGCEEVAATRTVDCVRADAHGILTAIGQRTVGIYFQKRWVLLRSNRGGPAKPPVSKAWFTFDGIRCWLQPPSTVFCARVDGLGYRISISKASVSVARLSDGERVYQRANG
jgi:hypothetical protein